MVGCPSSGGKRMSTPSTNLRRSDLALASWRGMSCVLVGGRRRSVMLSSGLRGDVRPHSSWELGSFRARLGEDTLIQNFVFIERDRNKITPTTAITLLSTRRFEPVPKNIIVLKHKQSYIL